MAESGVEVINIGRGGELETDSGVGIFNRRIDFHVARKPFSGFGNYSDGFKPDTLNPNPEPHKASISGNICEKSPECVEAGLDPELSFKITFRRIGAGLWNLGNTCFLNSVVQCLTYTEPLVAYLQSGKHQNSCRTSGFCALCAIQKHVNCALQSTGRSLEPKDLVFNLRRISRNFRYARQEDAHEYMVNLLQSMHKCCLPSGVPSESPCAYETSLVHKIFGGRLRSQVKCMQCSYCSNKFDPFLDLSLEVMEADSLLKALANFTAKDQLDGGAKQYHCQQCEQKVKALMQLTIHKVPHVLTVHLKRFSSLEPGQKIDKKIAFGPTLDLKPFVTGPYDGDVNYTLYGVLVHAGRSTDSGHYYCFVRTSSGMWYSLDDNEVFQVNERTVLDQEAYMLFYVRDRKSLVTKKPVNVIPRENLELKEKIENCTIEKKIDDPSLLTLSDKDAQTETPHNELCFQIRNDTSVDDVGHKKDPQSEHSLLVPPSEDTSKENPGTIINFVDYKEGSHSTGGDSVETLNLSDAAKNISGNNSSCDVENRNASGVKSPDVMVQQDSIHENESTEFVATSSGGSCKMEGTDSEMCDNEIIPVEMDAEASIEVDVLISPQKNDIEESQVGISSEKTGDPTIEGNHENLQKTKATQPGPLSGLPATTQHSSSGEIKKKRLELKAKRNLFKNHVPAMSLNSKSFLGVGLCMLKKKLKRRKEKELKKSHNRKRVSSGNDLSNCSLSHKKKAKFGRDNRNQILSEQKDTSGEGNIATEIIKNEFRDGVVGSTQARQTDAMRMLTRGLEGTTVARWDGIGVSLSEKLEARIAGTEQIGYVGDDWDDEYDRGKRKKVRTSKISFDGPNLFRKVATRNSKRKRAKLRRVENQPFRI